MQEARISGEKMGLAFAAAQPELEIQTGAWLELEPELQGLVAAQPKPCQYKGARFGLASQPFRTGIILTLT